MDNRDLLDTVPWHKLRDPAPPTRAYTPPVTPSPSPEPRWAMVAAVTLAVVAGIVVFAVVNTRPPKSAALTQSVAPVIQERIVERVITATPQPTAHPTEPPAPVVIVTVAPPPVVVAPPVRPQAQQPVQRQAVRNLPAPTQAPPAAWPAPARQTTRAVYVCADGAQFPQEDSRWAWGPFGQWHMEGSGDVVDIRDSLENNAAMGWHYKCRREWR